MPDASIRERLQHFLVAKGAVPEEPSRGDMDFRLGQDGLSLAIVEPSSCYDRTLLLAKIMKACELSTKCNIAYLAMPRTIAPNYDARILQNHGIGLIVFDDRTIDETLQARRNETPAPQSIAPQIDDKQSDEELRELRSQLNELRGQMTSLREEIARLQDVRHHQKPTEPLIISHSAIRPTPAEELPEFFTNNPWIDMLARRGREPYAG